MQSRTLARNKELFFAELIGDTKKVQEICNRSSLLRNTPPSASPARLLGAAIADIPGVLFDSSIAIPAILIRTVHSIRTGDIEALTGFKEENKPEDK